MRISAKGRYALASAIHMAQHRITSYNVCYTKLLRLSACAAISIQSMVVGTSDYSATAAAIEPVMTFDDLAESRNNFV